MNAALRMTPALQIRDTPVGDRVVVVARELAEVGFAALAGVLIESAGGQPLPHVVAHATSDLVARLIFSIHNADEHEMAEVLRREARRLRGENL